MLVADAARAGRGQHQRARATRRRDPPGRQGGADHGAGPPLAIGFVGGQADTLSSDGRLLALIDGDYSIQIYDLDAGLLVADHRIGERTTLLAFDPAATRLYGLVADQLRSWVLTPQPSAP